MAGYIINLDNVNALKECIKNGIYSTRLSPPSGFWRPQHEGTIADYLTMREGDNIYFFINRNIYGIGKLINISQDCKYLNFPEANKPNSFSYNDKKDFLLWDTGEDSINKRFICLFEPAPHFFITGVDMDDVLSSNPAAFKMLRAFWKVSFLKFEDEENQAFKDVILKFNQDALQKPEVNIYVFETSHVETHQQIGEKLSQADYVLDVSEILSDCADGDYIKHERALEAGILFQLVSGDDNTILMFGSWDYISHQVVASPFKPIDYMDKMDIFGYRYIQGFKPTKSKYLVIELKKDTARLEDIDQTMKYVDWINNEYTFGDYSMISAFLVAHDFSDDIREYKKEFSVRKYTVGMKPAKSFEWNELKLIKYSFDSAEKKIRFNTID